MSRAWIVPLLLTVTAARVAGQSGQTPSGSPAPGGTGGGSPTLAETDRWLSGTVPALATFGAMMQPAGHRPQALAVQTDAHADSCTLTIRQLGSGEESKDDYAFATFDSVVIALGALDPRAVTATPERYRWISSSDPGSYSPAVWIVRFVTNATGSIAQVWRHQQRTNRSLFNRSGWGKESSYTAAVREWTLDVRDQESAERIVKAVTHAARLCGAKADPF